MEMRWAHARAGFAGDHVRLVERTLQPKPVQRFHPSALAGRDGARARGLGLPGQGDRHGCGRIPDHEADTFNRVAESRRLAAASGRGTIPVVVLAVPTDRAVVEALAGAAIERAVVHVPCHDKATAERSLAELVTLTDPIRSH